jgi:hypothetical protein
MDRDLWRGLFGMGLPLGLAIIFLTFAFLTPILRTEYLTALLLWFFTWLAFFHLWFWLQSPITERDVRMIEYFYLGAATVSLFFYAHHVHERQWDYLIKASLPRFEFAELKDATERFVADGCGDEMPTLRRKECDARRELLTKLGDEPGAADYHSMLERLFDMRSRELNPLAENVRRLLVLAETHRLKEEMMAPKPLPIAGSKNRLLLDGQLTWPFILVLALALRLTKVTIETFGWSTKDEKR